MSILTIFWGAGVGILNSEFCYWVSIRNVVFLINFVWPVPQPKIVVSVFVILNLIQDLVLNFYFSVG